ncbi:MAG: hypothetical protein P8124_05480 [Gammaproteobacteria bacterium]
MPLRHPLRVLLGAAVVVSLAGTFQAVAGGTHDMPMGEHDMSMSPSTEHPVASGPDNRLVVDFPPAFKRQELANMRDHLESIQKITAYLAKSDFQAAAEVAEARLTRGGMSAHDRHQAARYMPKQMLAMGAAMHRAAGHFAIVAQDAAVSGNMGATLHALAQVQARCIACHRTYRMK